MTANRKWKANGKTKHLYRESKQNYARHVRTSICAVCKGISMYSVYIAMADFLCQRLFKPSAVPCLSFIRPSSTNGSRDGPAPRACSIAMHAFGRRHARVGSCCHVIGDAASMAPPRSAHTRSASRCRCACVHQRFNVLQMHLIDMVPAS